MYFANIPYTNILFGSTQRRSSVCVWGGGTSKGKELTLCFEKAPSKIRREKSKDVYQGLSAAEIKHDLRSKCYLAFGFR